VFQQIVSQEKTPTLSHVLPAFEAIIEKWKDHQIEHFEVSSIIDEGLMKLESYENHTDLTPAYSFAMRVYLCLFVVYLLIS